MRSLCACLALLILSGCASFSWKRPEMQLQSVSFTGGNLLSQKLHLELLVRNPNEREIELEGVSFDVMIGGERFASGSSAQAQYVAPASESRIALDARVQVLDLFRRLPELGVTAGKLRYHVKGEAVIKGFGRAPFDHSGELDVSRLFGRQRVGQ